MKEKAQRINHQQTESFSVHLKTPQTYERTQNIASRYT